MKNGVEISRNNQKNEKTICFDEMTFLINGQERIEIDGQHETIVVKSSVPFFQIAGCRDLILKNVIVKVEDEINKCPILLKTDNVKNIIFRNVYFQPGTMQVNSLEELLLIEKRSNLFQTYTLCD